MMMNNRHWIVTPASRWILTLLMLVGVFAVTTRHASACSCVMPPTPQNGLDQADAVFAGQVVGVSTGGGFFRGPFTSAATVQVSEVWKGTVDWQVVLTYDGSTCDYYFQHGQDYLIYAFERSNGSLGASICSRTALLSSAAADLAVLGDGAVRQPDPLPGSSPAVLLIALGVIVTAMLVVFAVGMRLALRSR